MQILYKENSHSFIASTLVLFYRNTFILANLEKEYKLSLRQTLFSTLAWFMVAVFGSLPSYYHLELHLVVHFLKVCLDYNINYNYNY